MAVENASSSDQRDLWFLNTRVLICSATIWMRVRVASRRNAPELIVRCLTPMFPTLTLAQRRVPAPDRA